MFSTNPGYQVVTITTTSTSPGCSYPPEALEAIKSWGPPPRDRMYEDKMKELKDREAVMAGDKPNRYLVFCSEGGGGRRLYTGMGDETRVMMICSLLISPIRHFTSDQPALYCPNCP